MHHPVSRILITGSTGGLGRAATAGGHARTLAVNTLAPDLLTALIDRPDRLIRLSSGMHRGAAGALAARL